MTSRLIRLALASTAALVVMLAAAPAAFATPVCTDGYMGGPPRSACGGRVFAEAAGSIDYVQLSANPQGFREYEHGVRYLAQLYPRWIDVYDLRDKYGPNAVSAGPDRIRAGDAGDTGDGRPILVVKMTDESIPDEGKQTMFFSLSIHGDEKGGIEGGVRAVEDLAMAAQDGGKITDGVPGYESTTGREPVFHQYEVSDVLANEVVYFVDMNVDGWAAGDRGAAAPGFATRGNSIGTDLNRQMPTVGRIDSSRNPLREREARYGHQLMHEVAAAGIDGLMAYGADIHGESQSRAWVDIMYPAGEFSSLKHRQLMAIAERTKSVIDDTLFMGIPDMIEEETGGDVGEGIEDSGAPANTVPTKPARWGTVWDTLGYTDTGFIGDYMASELGVTGMDYEIALNHSDASRPFGRPWGVLLQENYVNATRAIVKTAMAYAMFQDEEFADLQIDAGGTVGYVYNPQIVTDTDADGPGRLPGPTGNGIGNDGQPVEQKPYAATNMRFFEDQAKFVQGGFTKVHPADIAADPQALDGVDSLVLADVTAPTDALGRTYDQAAYFANLKAWVERGGNLVLTDRALHTLGSMGVVAPAAVTNVNVYQPYADFVDHSHPMMAGLRPNARQLSEATLVGYGIGNTASPMTTVTSAAFTGAGGHVIGTTGANRVSVGELPLGLGKIRIMGGGLGMPTEVNDHRYGLKDYALTYSGLFIMENSIKHTRPVAPLAPSGTPLPIELFVFFPLPLLARRLRRAWAPAA